MFGYYSLGEAGLEEIAGGGGGDCQNIISDELCNDQAIPPSSYWG